MTSETVRDLETRLAQPLLEAEGITQLQKRAMSCLNSSLNALITIASNLGIAMEPYSLQNKTETRRGIIIPITSEKPHPERQALFLEAGLWRYTWVTQTEEALTFGNVFLGVNASSLDAFELVFQGFTLDEIIEISEAVTRLLRQYTLDSDGIGLNAARCSKIAELESDLGINSNQ